MWYAGIDWADVERLRLLSWLGAQYPGCTSPASGVCAGFPCSTSSSHGSSSLYWRQCRQTTRSPSFFAARRKASNTPSD